MRIEEQPPELAAESSANAAIFVLEAENSNLRRLVVELLEKNQQLREQVRVLTSGRNYEISGDLATSHKVDRRGVDPRAA